MAAEKEEKEAQEPAAPAGPKLVLGMPIPLLAFVASNVLVMIGAISYIVWVSLIYKKPAITETQARLEISKKEEKKKTETGEGFFTVNYAEMTVTLRGAQGGKSHFVTVEATLVCGSEICQSQVEANRAKVEDAIQSVLSSRSYTELGSLETKFRVKHEVLGRVNSFLHETAATDLLFTNFVVQ